MTIPKKIAKEIEAEIMKKVKSGEIAKTDTFYLARGEERIGQPAIKSMRHGKEEVTSVKVKGEAGLVFRQANSLLRLATAWLPITLQSNGILRRLKWLLCLLANFGSEQDKGKERHTMALTSAQKNQIIKDFQLFEGDTGSPEVQASLLTASIQELTDHLKTHKRDNHSRRGLLKQVSKRRRLLKFLQNRSEDRYKKLIEKLGLSK